MNSEIFSLINAIFLKYPELKGSPVPFEKIEEAETFLTFRFPESYRKFLNVFGSGIVGAFPVFGLSASEALGNEWSVIEMTNRFRQENWPGTDDWAIISADHAGNPFGVDSKGQIWISDHDFGGISLVAKSFEDFIIRLCLQKGGTE